MPREVISPVSVEDGEPIINANCSEANDDWMRAGRLAEKADQGDENAREELDKMDDTEMVRFTGGSE